MFEYIELPELIDEVGTIIEEEQVSPGIYLLSARNDEELLARDYYAVTEKSPIPQKAKSYGRELPGLWLFSLDDGSEEYKIIKYEVSKYRTKNHLSLDELLRVTAFFAAQSFPEYFGTFPVPLITPRGYTMRHWVLDNGIYWIETDECEELLAVCYPVWSSELSDPAVRLGEQMEYDKKQGIEETLGYIFYPMRTSCILLLELMDSRPEWIGKVIGKPALMNAIYKVSAEYAVWMNHREQSGKNDGVSALLAELGMEVEPHIAENRVITFSPDVGDTFLLLEGRAYDE